MRTRRGGPVDAAPFAHKGGRRERSKGIKKNVWVNVGGGGVVGLYPPITERGGGELAPKLVGEGGGGYSDP